MISWDRVRGKERWEGGGCENRLCVCVFYVQGHVHMCTGAQKNNLNFIFLFFCFFCLQDNFIQLACWKGNLPTAPTKTISRSWKTGRSRASPAIITFFFTIFINWYSLAVFSPASALTHHIVIFTSSQYSACSVTHEAFAPTTTVIDFCGKHS